MKDPAKKRGMLGWIVAVFYLAGIIGAVDAVMNTRTSQGAIAWSVSLVSVPCVAATPRRRRSRLPARLSRSAPP